MATAISGSNFNQVVLQSDQPVIIDFWAQWCGPCRMVGPVLDEIQSEFAGKAIVGKVDVDKEQELAARFGIRNIPAILFFKNSEIVDKVTGVASKREFENKLNKLL